MLSMLRQAEDLSPDSTPRRISSNESDGRWADMHDGFVTGQEIQPVKHQPGTKDGMDLQLYDKTELSYTNSSMVMSGDLNSVGSRFHDSGRCKPCAFFHTKGCESAANCLFCHRCPAHEKQRRKRLRRQLCHSLLGNFDTPHSCRTQGDSWQAQPTKAGHSRMISTDSTSTCSGWGNNTEGPIAHSRQASTSSQATSVYESGDVGNMANLTYAAPYNPNVPPQMMPSHGSWQSWNESGPIDLEAMPARDTEESFPCAGDARSSMPPMPTSKQNGLMCTQPSPPPGVASLAQALPAALRVPAMCVPRSPTHQLNQDAPSFSLPATGQYEQQYQCPSMPGTPAGYMTSSCGNYQYAIVPVPVSQYQDGCCNVAAPTYTDQSQVQQQQWGPYEVNPYSPYQYADQYEHPAAAPMSPCGMVSADVQTQWW